MKKLICTLFILICLFVLVGCKNGLEGFELVESVVSMEGNDTYTGYNQIITVSDAEYSNTMQYDRENKIYKYVYEIKTLNSFDSEEQYTIEVEEEYYANNLRYYFENQNWITEELKGSSGSILYSFKRDYFEDTMVIPQILAGDVTFEGKLLADKVDEFFGEELDASNVNIIVVFDAMTERLKSISISYQTLSEETVTINTVISYQKVNLVLPN